jgi:predicted nucleic acid-binding protein
MDWFKPSTGWVTAIRVIRSQPRQGRQEIFDLGDNPVAIAEIVQMIVARQLDVLSIRQARGKIAAILDADAPIAAAMQQQRRHAHTRQDVADVALAVNAYQGRRHRRARAHPLKPRPLAAKLLVRGPARRDRRRHRRGAPGAFDQIEPGLDLFFRPNVCRTVHECAVKRQRANAPRVCRGKEEAHLAAF